VSNTVQGGELTVSGKGNILKVTEAKGDIANIPINKVYKRMVLFWWSIKYCYPIYKFIFKLHAKRLRLLYILRASA